MMNPPLNSLTFPRPEEAMLIVFDADGQTLQVLRDADGASFLILKRDGRNYAGYFGTTSADTMTLIAEFLSGELDTDVKPPRWTDGDVVVETTPHGEKTWVRAGAWTAPGHVGHVTTDESVDNLLDNPPAGYSGTVLRQQSVSK